MVLSKEKEIEESAHARSCISGSESNPNQQRETFHSRISRTKRFQPVHPHCEASISSSEPAYFKAFATAEGFSRQFTGFVYAEEDKDGLAKVICYRSGNDPEESTSPDLDDLCGELFAFTIRIPDEDDPQNFQMIFAGGGPEEMEFGRIK